MQTHWSSQESYHWIRMLKSVIIKWQGANLTLLPMWNFSINLYWWNQFTSISEQESLFFFSSPEHVSQILSFHRSPLSVSHYFLLLNLNKEWREQEILNTYKHRIYFWENLYVYVWVPPGKLLNLHKSFLNSGTHSRNNWPLLLSYYYLLISVAESVSTECLSWLPRERLCSRFVLHW